MINTRWIAIVALLVLFSLPIGGWILPGDSTSITVGREILFWAILALILAFVLFYEHKSLTSIGLVRPTWLTLGTGILGGILMTAAIALIYMVIFPLFHVPSDVGAASPIGTLPMWLKIAIVVRAAIFEEIFYRGFMIERLAELTRMRWLAALVSWCAFTAAHLPVWGWAHLLVAGTGGAILTVLYLWRRDLPANMLAHFATDAIGFLL